MSMINITQSKWVLIYIHMSLIHTKMLIYLLISSMTQNKEALFYIHMPLIHTVIANLHAHVKHNPK